MLADLRHIFKVSFTHTIICNTSERDSKQHILHLDQGLDCSTMINTSESKRACHPRAK